SAHLVANNRTRSIDAREPSHLCAKREVHVLAIHQEPLVEQADRLEQLSTIGRRSPTSPEYEQLLVILAVVLFPDSAAVRGAVSPKDVARRMDLIPIPLEQYL